MYRFPSVGCTSHQPCSSPTNWSASNGPSIIARVKQQAMHERKMCKGCGLKRPTCELALEGKAQWCAGCRAAQGAVCLRKQQMCEGCGLKVPKYGPASEGKRRWCVGCGDAKGVASLQKQQICEGCGLPRAGCPRGQEPPKVRKTPSWPTSWANFSLLWLYTHRNA
jgi:hypothetical protein